MVAATQVRKSLLQTSARTAWILTSNATLFRMVNDTGAASAGGDSGMGMFDFSATTASSTPGDDSATADGGSGGGITLGGLDFSAPAPVATDDSTGGGGMLGGFDFSSMAAPATPAAPEPEAAPPVEAAPEPTKAELEAQLEAAMEAEDFDLCEELNKKIEAMG